MDASGGKWDGNMITSVGAWKSLRSQNSVSIPQDILVSNRGAREGQVSGLG